MIDQNPQIGAKLHELVEGGDGVYRTVKGETITEGEYLQDQQQGTYFFGCGECKTDEYLMDL